jgi:hypothetical protein
MCTALVVGNTIGMGIFLLPASLAPYGFNALVGWGITVAGMTVVARVFVRLARTFPDADGPYAYMRSTLGEWPAFLALWCYWISAWITNSALAVGVVGYLSSAFPMAAAVPPLATAMTVLWVFIGTNLLGVRAGGRVQVATTVLKLLPMAVVIGLGLWLLLVEPAAYSRHPPATPLERLSLAVGREAAGEMLPIAWATGDLRIGGYVGSPAVNRSRRDGQYFSLNRRPIRSGLLAVMLERPYAGRLPPGRSPLAVVQIELDPALVDVNVHPRKAEVRLAQERAVYQALGQAVGAALAPFPLQEVWGVSGWPFPETPTAPAALAEGGTDYEAARQAEALGQVRNTYIVARAFEELIVVDQHAAHEALLTERLLAGEKAIRMSPPARLDLMLREAELLAAHLSTLADLGLEVEPFGGNSFLLRALPASLTGQDPPVLLDDLLAELAAGRALDPDALREKLAMKAACRAAVKAGDWLSLEQQQALLDELLAAWSPATCPHGRPALFRLTVEEIERRFLRR